jgi:indoleamine 2,3-dioxygenase
MRYYMPGGHRAFLEKIEEVANIRQYAETSASGDEIVAAYNLAVATLGELRDKHIKIVARYIIGPSRKLGSIENMGINLAVASTGKSSMTGTGGTQLMPFLKQSRDETKEMALS